MNKHTTLTPIETNSKYNMNAVLNSDLFGDFCVSVVICTSGDFVVVFFCTTTGLDCGDDGFLVSGFMPTSLDMKFGLLSSHCQG